MTRLTYERRIQLLALGAGLPGSLVALILLWTGDFSSGTAWTLTFFIVVFWTGFALSAKHRVIFSLQTLSNLLAALREEDFSMRAREARSDDAMGEVMVEVNALSETLREQRLGALEATALLRTVMEEIDLAIFTFDQDKKLRLVNRAGVRLLGRPLERLLGFTAEELGLGACLEGEPVRMMELAFLGSSGRWGLRRGSFREEGWPHHLVVLSDRGDSLGAILDDLRQGLGIIRSRTEALGRFMTAYSQLARLPQPKLLPVNISEWVGSTVKLETRVKVSLGKGPEAVISADRDQLEQLLINLIRNAADAALETMGGVQVGWVRRRGQVELWVVDDGPGLPNTANLFVPFFTTKPGGSGIGLVLSRQIAEAHGGELTLRNRSDARGCEARLVLPM